MYLGSTPGPASIINQLVMHDLTSNCVTPTGLCHSDDHRKASLTASQAGSPTQAMAMLLLNNQLQQNLQQMNRIEQKLTVTLPQEVVAVAAAIAANRQQQIVQKGAIIQAMGNLTNFDTEIQRKAQVQKAQISNLKTRLDNIRETRMIGSPTRSLRHVGLGRSVIAILGAIVGVLLALLAV